MNCLTTVNFHRFSARYDINKRDLLGQQGKLLKLVTRDLRSFVIRFDFESYVRFVLMVRFEIFESSALSIVIRKETIVGG